MLTMMNFCKRVINNDIELFNIALPDLPDILGLADLVRGKGFLVACRLDLGCSSVTI
jgi:hypothetical protein